ncbi:hypothetical protein D3C86_1373140 [compost metagenome]
MDQQVQAADHQANPQQFKGDKPRQRNIANQQRKQNHERRQADHQMDQPRHRRTRLGLLAFSAHFTPHSVNAYWGDQAVQRHQQRRQTVTKQRRINARPDQAVELLNNAENENKRRKQNRERGERFRQRIGNARQAPRRMAVRQQRDPQTGNHRREPGKFNQLIGKIHHQAGGVRQTRKDIAQQLHADAERYRGAERGETGEEAATKTPLR